MRSCLALLAVLCAAPRSPAEVETWLRAEHPENASYFSPKLRISRLQDSLAFWPGAGLGWIVGSVVSVGFEGYVLAADPRRPGPGQELSMALGGLALEATPFPERRTHLSFNLFVGAGGSQAGGEAEFDSLSAHPFFFVAPGAKLGFNLTPNVRLCPGASYMWIPDRIRGLEDGGFDGTMLTLDLVLKKPDAQ